MVSVESNVQTVPRSRTSDGECPVAELAPWCVEQGGRHGLQSGEQSA